jgi:hypothetical protein
MMVVSDDDGQVGTDPDQRRSGTKEEAQCPDLQSLSEPNVFQRGIDEWEEETSETCAAEGDTHGKTAPQD